KLGLTSVTWIGYSLGGMIGMRLAVAHPEVISSLVLIATTASEDPPELREPTSQLWELFRDGHREDIVDSAMAYFLSSATYKEQPELARHYRDQFVKMQEVDGLYAVAQAVMNRTDITEQIGTITVPTLVIAGGNDIGGAAPPYSELIASR